MRIERRLREPRWLLVAVPAFSLVFAFSLPASSSARPGTMRSSYRLIIDAAFLNRGALGETLTSATPLAFTGLAAAAAFRMRLFNIGGEGQLYMGAITAAAAGLYLGGKGGPSAVAIAGMVVAGCAGGAAWGLIPGILRAFFKTNEIITSLMLNYVAAYVLTYLIFNTESYWRETTGFNASVFPTSKTLPDSALWPGATIHLRGGIVLPLGAGIAVLVAVLLWALYSRTRFGFEVQVLGWRLAAGRRYAGMRTRRKILAVMAISGAIAGLGGASQDGDFRHTLDADPNGLQRQYYGYTGIVVAALARYNPFAVVLVAFLIGGSERGQHAAGRRLPVRARRRDAGDHSLLGARGRAARSLPRPLRTRRGRWGLGGGRVNNSLLVVVLASGVAYGTPLLYAALGELLTERAGVLNLGVEGMMLIGAVMGFWAVQRVHAGTGLSLAAAIGVAALAGSAMALIHAFLVITLRASQIVSGLALTIFAGAAGLSSYLGNDLNLSTNPARHQFHAIFPASMQNWPVVGPILFGQNILVYASWLCVVAVSLYLSRTRPGLNVRAVGESPAAADAMGINVVAYRYAHTLVGGAFAGVAGATFTLAITPQWVDGITGGAGWIAIALVIFAFWRPELCLVGAYFFGALQALSPQLQAREIRLGPTELWTNSLPYVMTVLVLVLASSSGARRRLGAPASLGLPFVREER